MRNGMSRALSAALALSVLGGCQDMKPRKGGKETSSTTVSSETYKGKGLALDMYVMSKCPFGVQAVQKVKPLLAAVGAAVTVNVNFIGYKQTGPRKRFWETKDGWGIMHGEPEHKGNIATLCAQKFATSQKQLLSFLDCYNDQRTWKNIPAGWEGCADKAGINVAKTKACYGGKEGEDLARTSYQLSEKKKARGSPTVHLAGKAFSLGSKVGFLRKVCPLLDSGKPSACNNLPAPAEVSVVTLVDKRCAKCRSPQGTINILKSRFDLSKLTVKELDYGTPEGKALYKAAQLKFLPALLFEPGVEKADSYSKFSRYLKKRGKYQMLRLGSKFDPTAEICDNNKDDTGNGKVDCADPTCKETVACRKEIKNKIDLFVMSQCPYGVKALDSLKTVLPNFGGKVKFDVHYIANKTPQGFKALHGQPEVDENIRQLCAKKHYARKNKYLEYIWCRNKNYRSNDWKGCATGGISPAKIEACFKGEGQKLLEEDIKLGNALGFGASPTWMANNRFKFSGVKADQIKSSICQRNKGLPNCNKTLKDDGPMPAAGSCGG